MARLIAPDFTPVPPQEIQRRIAQIDPSLFLKWVEGSPQLGRPSAWGVCQRWDMNDPRRKHIFAGDMSPGDDYDLITSLPEDCQADEAYGWIVNGLRRYSDKSDIKRMLERVHTYNASHQNSLYDDVNAEALNYIEVRGGQLFEKSTGKSTVKVMGRGHTPTSRGKKASEL